MLKSKKVLSLLLVVLIVFSFAACNKNKPNTPVSGEDDVKNNDEVKSPESGEKTAYPFKFTDDSGKEIALNKAPEKIASGSPAVIEMIFALKGEDSLVAVTDYCNYPEEATKKEKAGDYNGPNIEKLISLGTDLYITDHISDDVRAQLEAASVIVVVLATKDYRDVFNKIELVGKMIDKNIEAADTLAKMKSREESLLASVKDLQSKRVFYEIWHDPLMTAGQGSFIDEMIKMLGCENIAGDAISPYAEFSVETLIERNPQIYLTSDDGMKTVEDIKARTGYDQLDAVKNERIYFLSPDVTSIPGPRIVEGLEVLAEAIYSEVFYGK